MTKLLCRIVPVAAVEDFRQSKLLTKRAIQVYNPSSVNLGLIDGVTHGLCFIPLMPVSRSHIENIQIQHVHLDFRSFLLEPSLTEDP